MSREGNDTSALPCDRRRRWGSVARCREGVRGMARASLAVRPQKHLEGARGMAMVEQVCRVGQYFDLGKESVPSHELRGHFFEISVFGWTFSRRIRPLGTFFALRKTMKAAR